MSGVIAGILAGVLQYILLQAVSARVTGIKKGSVFPVLLIKLALYGVIIALALTVFRDMILYIGCGYAAGMGIGVILSLISGLHHRKDIAAPAAPSPSDTNEKTEGE